MKSECQQQELGQEQHSQEPSCPCASFEDQAEIGMESETGTLVVVKEKK
jgi:hypothetical protein